MNEFGIAPEKILKQVGKLQSMVSSVHQIELDLSDVYFDGKKVCLLLCDGKKVCLLLCLLGGATGGYLLIKFTGKHEGAVMLQNPYQI